ncbi:MAG TPA: tripartite tricarboxylate transporter substrate-binding protein, partial [Burkholderiales bacterium]|nr:tripartite tricarboxylate transporter substrate-binding protein [Burkholderiales bacterium]
PAGVVAKLNADFNALLQQSDMRESLSRQDLNTVGGSAERFGDMVRHELARWARVVTAAKIKAD